MRWSAHRLRTLFNGLIYWEPLTDSFRISAKAGVAALQVSTRGFSSRQPDQYSFRNLNLSQTHTQFNSLPVSSPSHDPARTYCEFQSARRLDRSQQMSNSSLFTVHANLMRNTGKPMCIGNRKRRSKKKSTGGGIALLLAALALLSYRCCRKILRRP